jgi:DNA polymerase-3 subunit beta
MMQVKVDRLRAAMKAVDDVIEKRSTIPILSNVMIRSTPGQMTLTGTDMEIMVEKVVDLEDAGANKAMDFTVSASLLKSIAGKLPIDGVAAIEADGNTGITVKCGRARFKLPTLPSEDFPKIAIGGWDAQWEQDKSTLVALIESVRFAQSTEETRYYLNGIYLHVPSESECMFAAATDGSRLARFHCDVPDGAADMPGIIIHRKAIKALADLVDEESGAIEFAVSKSKWQVSIGTTVLTGKAIDGQFPDYTRVIPVANDKVAWIYPGPLAAALERVLTIATDKTRAVAFDFAEDVLTLSVASPENGTASEDLECEYDGEPLRIGFNGRYMLDMLAQLKGGSDEVRAKVALADAAAPALWQQSDDARQLYVLMPLRV